MLKIKANDNINKLKTNLHELHVMCSLPHIFEFYREREEENRLTETSERWKQ